MLALPLLTHSPAAPVLLSGLYCRLQGVIACLLNGAVDHDQMPTRPIRPTHSRT
jgi:hypothetical protein